MRGAQVTDNAGIAQFITIFPGWYIGRTVHIHFKVHRDKATVLTAQMYFDESVIAAAHSVAPYNDHVGRDMTNATDYVYDPDSCAVVATLSGGQVAALTVGIPT
ncbi:hypothetical protein [Mycolicibacterium hodleri]|uniref:Intradiol ring-cleavage dioxygenases domain-containing protein n=1 Tax=Mycolicibacterium hodleri TaxID=49897 RepID=A0A502E8A4_9MYCO|nr:hypothetical protein [Mycolicibacterium hodleri]TPG33209.1 hypothetical protein EAH80_17710 [Mycolicibacterium hodleri]